MGLSTAKVMQLAAMKVKMIKSNQSLDVRSLQNCLVLKSEYFMHLTCQNYRITINCRNHGMDSYYLKLKCISKRVVSWYQGLVQVRKGQLADNCNHNINIGVGPLILLYLFQM